MAQQTHGHRRIRSGRRAGGLKEKSYSFWEPLDEEYLTAMYSYVGSQGYSYVSFFNGARAFFGYLPWSPQLEAATYRSFTSTYNRLVAVNMRQGHSSGTGQTLAHLLPADLAEAVFDR